MLFDSYDEILFTVTCVFSAAASVGSVFVTEALQTATALTDAAYARTSERLTKKKKKSYDGILVFFVTWNWAESDHVSRGKKSLSEGTLKPSDLLSHFKQTEARTKNHIRAAELLDNTVELIREMVYTHTMVQTNSHGIKAASPWYSTGCVAAALRHGCVQSVFQRQRRGACCKHPIISGDWYYRQSINMFTAVLRGNAKMQAAEYLLLIIMAA